MIMLGCKPEGRNTEQHDIMFAVAETIDGCKQQILDFWPQVQNGPDDKLPEQKIHIDCYMQIDQVAGYAVSVDIATEIPKNSLGLYFVNLGGYTLGKFAEFHKPLLIVANTLKEATVFAMQDSFVTEHGGISGAKPHRDDEFKISTEPDADDYFQINIPGYSINLIPNPGVLDSEPIITGYYKLSRLKE